MASPVLTHLGQTLRSFWDDRNERERKQIALAAAVVVLGLVYMLFIDPAYSGRKQLEKSLPGLRKDTAEMQVMSEEAARFANAPAPVVQELSKESIEAGMTSKGLKPQTVAVTGNLAKIQLSSVPFSSLVAWLDDMQKTARLTVTEANIVSLPQQDTVNATLTLQQQKSE